MPLDPQVQAMGIGGPPADGSQPPAPVEPPTVEQMRGIIATQTQMLGPGPDVARVEDRDVPSAAGGVPVRIYWPEGDGPFPVLTWFHGGGYVIGDLDYADPVCRTLANGAGAIVVSVDYRLAPEHAFPAAADDALAALAWVTEQAEALGGDPTRIAVGGDSAGGGLAAIAAIDANRRDVPALRFQLLVYPVTDATRSLPSYVDNADGYGLTASSMEWFLDQYLGDHDPADPRVSPLSAPADELAGLPSALVITAEYDVLRDEGEAYARRLEEAGVPVTLSRYDGQIHGFFGMAAVLDGGKAALAEAGDALRQAFA